jgi:hypothetical protein
MDYQNLTSGNNCIIFSKKDPTAESAFLFRDHDHPVTVSSLGVVKRPQPFLTVLKSP